MKCLERLVGSLPFTKGPPQVNAEAVYLYVL